ncbi:MAG: glycerol-3-phosphate acyltransferase [Anaerolineales bacterium]
MDIVTTVIVISVAYMIGSFPTAYIVGRWRGVNIFEYGSGNMGTTNAIRTLGLGWGLLVLAGDLGKGILAVLIAREIAPAEPLSTQASASVIAALVVVMGHNWSVIASIIAGSIKGGKGAATAGGTLLIIMPTVAIAIPLFILALIIITTRYMSLAVMTSAVVAAFIVAGMVALGELEPIYLIYCTLAGLIIYRHRENIRRLLAGNERRLGERVHISQK